MNEDVMWLAQRVYKATENPALWNTNREAKVMEIYNWLMADENDLTDGTVDLYLVIDEWKEYKG